MNYANLHFTLADERDRQRELADIRARAPAEALRRRPNHLAARQPNVRSTPHYLGPMDSDDCPLYGARTWKAERGKGGRRPCCDAGKTEIPAPECDLNDLTPIDRLMSEVEFGEDGKMRRTRRCKQFHENIVAYNNSVSFASEGVDNVDRAVAPFTFKMQGNIYHQLPPLVPVDGERPRFMQIYTVDATQQQADDRLHYNPHLDRAVLEDLYASLRRTNPYIAGLKTCEQRICEQPAPNDARVRLVMQDPRRHDPRTYNRPTSDEVAVVIVGNPDEAMREAGGRDIAVQYQDGRMQRIPYSHSCYMALRYPLMLPFGEQSWHMRIPLRDHAIPLDDNFRAVRLQRQGLPPVGADDEIPHHPILDDNGPRVGRGGTIRVTQLEFYAYWMQIRPRRFSRVLHAGNYLSLAFCCGHC